MRSPMRAVFIERMFELIRSNRWRLAVLGIVLGIASSPFWTAPAASAANCVTAANPITCENALPGDPMDDWYSQYSYGDIQGFTNAISYQIGDTVSFKVKSPVTYNIQILRL